MGKKEYDKLLNYFKVPRLNLKEYDDITHSFDEVFNSRVGTIIEEINDVTKYNYVVVNDDLDKAVDKVEAILISEKCRVDRIEEVFLNDTEELLHEGLLDNKIFIN